MLKHSVSAAALAACAVLCACSGGILSGTRSQTFLPADKDLAASAAARLNIYTRTAGNVTDSLTLTSAGTAGAFTYQYVGGGPGAGTTRPV